MRIDDTTYGESVIWMPIFENGEQIGPIENGMMYIVRPRIQPVKRSFMAQSVLHGDIQLPSVPLTPSLGVGMVSSRLRVEMNVLDSTRAVSLGLVKANQLLNSEINV